MEATVGEVVLDPRAADPADTTVNNEDLAVVDAARRAHDANLDAAGPQPLVEPVRPAGPRADPVDDDPHRDPFGGLGEQRARELLPDLAWPEAVLVDVNRAGRGGDVREDRREEVAPARVDVDGRGHRLVEPQREVAELNRGARETRRAGADIVHVLIAPGRVSDQMIQRLRAISSSAQIG